MLSMRRTRKETGLGRKIWQAFATLPDVKTVGVMGDERTYSYMVGLEQSPQLME